MSETKRMKIVVTYALPSEEVEIDWPEAELVTVFTDVGKVKAAIAVTHALQTEKPDMVLNVGTAGTLGHSVGDIIAGSTYIDRDYASLGLPGIEWEFRSEKGSLGLPSIIGGREQTGSFAISTGDNFVTRDTRFGADAIDMEAAAELQACQAGGTPFVAVKYIADIVGSNSVEVWQSRLAAARKALTAYFRKYKPIPIINQ